MMFRWGRRSFYIACQRSPKAADHKVRWSAPPKRTVLGLSPRLVQVQDFIQRTLTVAFQVQRHVLEAQPLENGVELPCHFGRQGAPQLVARDLQPHQLPVVAYAELAESKRLHFFLAALHGLDEIGRASCRERV